jgi:hypothetical protein
MRMGTKMSLWAITVALLAASLGSGGCSGGSGTVARVYADFDASLAIDQIRLEATVADAPLVGGLLPVKPKRLTSHSFIDVRFADRLAGAQPVFTLAGLSGGAQVAGGAGSVTLVKGQTVTLTVALSAASCSLGQHACNGGGCFDDEDPTHCTLACVSCPVPTAHGFSSCLDFACRTQCDTGFTQCGSDCVDPTQDQANCGGCAKPCAAAEMCQAGHCVPNPCSNGEHPCSGNCVSSSDVAHCGASCSPCAAPANGAASCDGTSCSVTCASGYHACGGACVSNHDVAHCGASCTACPAPAGSTATCDGNSCGLSCGVGYHTCGATCADNSSPLTCGSRCTPCTAPANGTATCVGGACGVTCSSGYVPCGGGCVPSAQGCTATWVLQSTATAPAARSRPSMAYDANRGVSVLYGGYNSTTAQTFDDTWEWNGTAWRQASPPATPGARSGSAMVFDEAHGEIVLFGGETNTGAPLGDTWSYDGATWQSRATTPPSGMAARSFASAVWDSGHGVVLLFAGSTGAGLLNDLWTWDGAAWKQPTITGATPPARMNASALYDPQAAELVVFGGLNSTMGTSVLGDTWVLSAGSWSQVSGTAPSARAGAAFAWHGVHAMGVLFSGDANSATSYPTDTWTYAGGAWHSITPTGTPAGRWRGGLVFDAERGVMVLFGGGSPTSYLNDTWELVW